MGDAADVGSSTATTAEPPEATKLCSACCEELPKSSFSRKQWMCRQQRRCRDCTESGREIQVATAASACSGKKKKPTRAADHKGVHQKSTPGVEFTAKVAGHFCSWCGKAEETGNRKLCPLCKNIEYCSDACQKAGWREHKLVCEELKKGQKSTKKERKQPGMSTTSKAPLVWEALPSRMFSKQVYCSWPPKESYGTMRDNIGDFLGSNALPSFVKEWYKKRSKKPHRNKNHLAEENISPM